MATHESNRIRRLTSPVYTNELVPNILLQPRCAVHVQLNPETSGWVATAVDRGPS